MRKIFIERGNPLVCCEYEHDWYWYLVDENYPIELIKSKGNSSIGFAIQNATDVLSRGEVFAWHVVTDNGEVAATFICTTAEAPAVLARLRGGKENDT